MVHVPVYTTYVKLSGGLAYFSGESQLDAAWVPEESVPFSKCLLDTVVQVLVCPVFNLTTQDSSYGAWVSIVLDERSELWLPESVCDPPYALQQILFLMP